MPVRGMTIRPRPVLILAMVGVLALVGVALLVTRRNRPKDPAVQAVPPFEGEKR